MPLLGNEKKGVEEIDKEMCGLRNKKWVAAAIDQDKNMIVLQKSFEIGFPFSREKRRRK